ncbi:MAG: LamG domain-containing protein [Candidatus Moranbacteria bacterium]|nr:LamG domain-containing protein [Candidatus Moranbacteria bacterium]
MLSGSIASSKLVGTDIATVGTITTGTWNGNIVAAQYGGTGINTSASTGVPSVSSGTWSVNASLAATLGGTAQTTYATGDILYASASNTLSKLAIGTDGFCLKVATDVPAWATCGGGGSTLQGAYDTDTNGSDTLITLSANDDGLVFSNPTSSGTDSAFLLQLNQQNTTATVVALDIIQSSNAANGANITANSIDTETGLSVTANGLTSGKVLAISSSSTAQTGNVAEFTQSGSNASNTGSVLKVSNTGTASANTALYVDHRATGTGNLALRVDDEASDTTPFIIDGEGRVGIGTSSISDSASTERLLQVGSETNRGNSVTYGEVVTKGLQDISALTDIKDVYVYDTTADSDGGRWIDWATTESLSWYTEALDDGPNDPCNIATDDRCYKASFPRKAILVVTGDALYIFDAQDNRMWMKFSQNASGYALGVDTNNDPSSVTALNGVIYVGTNGTAAGGLYAIDFTQDRMWNYDTTDRSGADLGIGSRNSAITYNSDNNTNFDLGTVGTVADWGRINDVSAAVITNSTTQITTAITPRNGTAMVALATDSGLTLINLVDQKLLQYSDATDNDYNSVVITRTAKLYGLNEALGQAEMWSDVDDDKASEVAGTPSKILDELSTPPLTKSAPTVIAGAPDALEVVERGSLADGGVLATAAIASSSDLLYIGTNQGLSEVHLQQTAATTWNGWSKLTDTTHQTPLIPATAKAAILFDDASGNVTDSIKTNILEPKGTPTYGVNGVRGKAMSFNGTTQYLCADGATDDATCEVDADFNVGTTGFTVSGWFKHSSTAPVTTPDVVLARCFTTAPAAATGCFSLWMNTTGTMTVGMDDDATWTIGTGSTFDANAATTQTYNDNQWHFFSFSRTNAGTIAQFTVDGKPATITTTAAPTLTFDGNQILGIGTDCSTGAACATGGNFWDGSLDDITWSSGGATTTDTITLVQARRLYNDARPAVGKRTVTVADATTATASTIGDSGESWIPNEFAGTIVELTGGTGSGQTRRVVSNTATTMTVSPAFTTTPDTTTDFEVEPERLYGASNSVTSIGITGESPMGEARMMCAGTNSGTDTGGVTCFNHQAGPNIVADVFHADAGQFDDSNVEWTGTDYDDMQSIDVSGRAMVFGSMGHFYTETQDVRLGQGLDYLANQIFNVQNAVKNLGMQTLAGSSSLEVGLTGGSDLAERYYSNESLEAGEVVSLDNSLGAGVKKSMSAYQKDVIGIVATSPGIVLGQEQENAYPIALAGRVPVKVTNENGPIYTGDRITASSRPGYAMRAVQAGRVLGTTLSDTTDWVVCEGEDPTSPEAILCATAFVFVNLSDYYGMPVELAMAERDTTLGADGLSGTTSIDSSEQGLGSDTASIRLATSMPTKQENILSFLKELRDAQTGPGSEILTGRVAVSGEVITPTLYADTIFAKSIKADSIEGLEIFTNQLGSLDAKYQELSQSVTVAGEGDATDLKMLTLDSAEVKLALNVLGTLTARGGITVGGDAEFNGDTVFNKLATFFGITTFKESVLFEKTPTFSKDTAGFAVIKEGQRTVTINFEDTYAKQPIVSVTPTNERSVLLDDEDVSSEVKADIKAVEADFREAFFADDVKYLVTNKSQKGFTIVLNKPATRELTFSWVALSVSNGNTFYSEEKPEQVTEDAKEEDDVEVVQDETDGDINPEPPSPEPSGEVSVTETSAP